MIEYRAYHKNRPGKGAKRRADRAEEGQGPGRGAEAAAGATAPDRVDRRRPARRGVHRRGVRLRLLVAHALAALHGAHRRHEPVRERFARGSVGDRPRRRVGHLWSVPAKRSRGACPDTPGSAPSRSASPFRTVWWCGSGRTPVAMVNLDVLHYLDEEGRPFKRLTAYDPKEPRHRHGIFAGGTPPEGPGDGAGSSGARPAAGRRGGRTSPERVRGPFRRTGRLHGGYPGRRAAAQGRHNGRPRRRSAGSRRPCPGYRG